MNIKRFPTYVDAMNALKEKIASLPRNLDRPKFIIAPEVYTFALEQIFYSLGRGSFDVKVTSFTKLYYDMLPQSAAISRAEAVAVVSAIAQQNEEKLRYYSGAFNKRGFALKVYETLEKLSSSGVEPDALNSDNVLLGLKLSDLKFIYSRYIDFTRGKLVDTVGRLEALTRFITDNDTVFDGSDVYLVNFDLFTKTQRSLIDAVAAKARQVEIYRSETINAYSMKRPPAVYAAFSKQQEYDRVADCIYKDVMEGKRFSDISVVGENLDYSRIKRAFDSRGIRFYYDKKRRLSESEPGRFIMRVMRCVTGGMTGDNMIALAGCRLACPDKSGRDKFIRFVKAHSAFFVSAKKQFDIADDPDRDEAEKVRLRLTEFVRIFSEKTLFSAEEFARKINDVFSLAGVNGEDEKNGRYYTLIMQTALSLKKVYGDAPVQRDRLFSAYANMTDSIGVSLIPNETDAVFVGPVNAKRGIKIKKLYVTGFNEGVLPAVKEDTGLISDADINALSEEGVIIEPTAERQNDLMRDELLQLILSAGEVVFSYLDDGENKKSYLVRMMEKKTGLCSRGEITDDWFAGVLEEGKDEDILRAFPSRAACVQAALSPGCGRGYSAVRAALEREISHIRSDLSLSCPDVTEGGMTIRSMSPSSLKDFYDCPKMYFYKYGLGIRKPKDGKVAASDIGTVLHKIIEKYVASGKYDNPSSDGAAIADDELSQRAEFSLPVNARLKKYVRHDAIFLCEKTAAQLTGGSFSCVGEEIRFGDGEEGGTSFRVGGVRLCGQIDRVDAFGTKARVVDYKSGGKVELRPEDVYYGQKLQLPIYSEVARRMGYVPAAMFYFPVNDSGDAGLLKGYYIDDPILYDEMIKTKDTLAFDPEKKKYMLSPDVYEGVIKYALALAEKAVQAIKSGYCAAHPISKDEKTVPCVYCDYASVCRGRSAVRKYYSVQMEDMERAVRNEID